MTSLENLQINITQGLPACATLRIPALPHRLYAVPSTPIQLNSPTTGSGLGVTQLPHRTLGNPPPAPFGAPRAVKICAVHDRVRRGSRDANVGCPRLVHVSVLTCPISTVQLLRAALRHLRTVGGGRFLLFFQELAPWHLTLPPPPCRIRVFSLGPFSSAWKYTLEILLRKPTGKQAHKAS